MQEQTGWVKLHRKILDNPICTKDSDYFAVWCFILLSAAHSQYDDLFCGKRVTLQSGQFITGRKKIADKLHIHESKVQRILKSFEIEQQIEQQTTKESRLITVANWGSYQKTEQQNEQQLNNKRTTTEQQLNTIQECKNVENGKNGKNEENVLRMFEEFWKAYPRKIDKKKSLKIYSSIVKKDGSLIETIQTSIELFNKTVFKDVKDIKYIPHPSTWLNGERWNDEVASKQNNLSKKYV